MLELIIRWLWRHREALLLAAGITVAAGFCYSLVAACNSAIQSAASRERREEPFQWVKACVEKGGSVADCKRKWRELEEMRR